MILDDKRLNSPAGNHRVAHGPASIKGHTPIALKGGLHFTYQGVRFFVQIDKEGRFFALADLPIGLSMIVNPKTKQPWSKKESCLWWTKRVIRKRGRERAGVRTI